MLNSKETENVEQLILDRVLNRKMFTAFDVTLSVRSFLRVSHANIRNIVHNYFLTNQMADYTRSTIQSPTGPTLLYHHVSDDPSSYVFGGVVSTVPVVPMPSISVIDNNTIQQMNAGFANSSPKMSNSPNADKGRFADGRGTYSVPVKLVKSIGLEKFNKAYVKVNGNKLEISKDMPDTECAVYTVDKSNQLRLSKSLFIQAKILGKCDFEEQNDKILVTSAS